MGWNCFRCVKDQEKEEISQVYKSKDYPWEIYSLKELLHATNNFHNDNKIGEGAVKRLKTISAKAEMEFAVEVEILGRVRHKNLLGLRGFYAGGDERLIVYDYMPNHSLITHLHGQLASDCLLDWRRRMSIIIGSAEGLAFGVLLLEIISAKKPLEKLPGGVKRDIVQWVTPYVQKGAFDHIADPRLKGKFDQDQLKSTVMIALRCTDSNAENRPSMFEVVDWLKGGVGRRKKETSEVEDLVDEEDEDNEDNGTDYEEYRYKIEKSNMRRTRVG
ncbi:hypothetical protein QYF36_003555 [Acer negundo]|nr:hypothetical protein QYF36_003555 [Acer negundo]